MTPLGLIAGEGVFPVLVARGARAAGRKVICVGMRGNAWPQLQQECDEFHWAGVTRLSRIQSGWLLTSIDIALAMEWNGVVADVPLLESLPEEELT